MKPVKSIQPTVQIKIIQSPVCKMIAKKNVNYCLSHNCNITMTSIIPNQFGIHETVPATIESNFL